MGRGPNVVAFPSRSPSVFVSRMTAAVSDDYLGHTLLMSHGCTRRLFSHHESTEMGTLRFAEETWALPCLGIFAIP